MPLRRKSLVTARPYAISIAAWTIFVLLLMLRDVLFVRVHSWSHIPWAQMAAAELDWAVWGLLTPLVLAFSRRYRISASAPLRLWMFYAGAAALTTVVQIVGGSLIIAASAWLCGIDAGFGTILAMIALTRWQFDLLVFCGIVAVAQAIRLRREAAEFALRASRMETQLAQARLQALKSQLHPHFLFNSLHAVAALIVKSRNQAALEMLSHLSDFLRIVLDHAEVQKVSLKEELDLLCLYLEIQKVRFGDRLQVRLDVPPGLQPIEVPYLLLQPLVENAIEHGVERHATASAIDISAYQDDRGVHLLVKNSGAPASTDAVRERIGLGNTRERLRLLYGERQHVDIRRPAEGGVVVEIVLHPSADPIRDIVHELEEVP